MGRPAKRLGRPLMNMEAAARYTGFTERQLKRRLEERTLPIPVIKAFGRNYFDPDDLDKFIASLPREIPAHDLVAVTEVSARKSVAKAKKTQRELLRRVK